MFKWLRAQYGMGTWITLLMTLIIGVVVFGFGAGGGWAMVDLNGAAAQDAANTFILLVFVAAIVERATEAIVTAWRPMGQAQLDRQLAQLEALPPGEREPDAIVAAKEACDRYKNRTRGIAIGFGLTAGILVAAVGIRMLEGLVAGDALVGAGAVPGPGQPQAAFDELRRQSEWFRRLDIVLTGLVIAGGSEGVHKVTKVFESVLARGVRQAQG